MEQFRFIRTPEELSGSRVSRPRAPVVRRRGRRRSSGGPAQQVVTEPAHVGERRLGGDRLRPLDVRAGLGSAGDLVAAAVCRVEHACRSGPRPARPAGATVRGRRRRGRGRGRRRGRRCARPSSGPGRRPARSPCFSRTCSSARRASAILSAPSFQPRCGSAAGSARRPRRAAARGGRAPSSWSGATTGCAASPRHPTAPSRRAAGAPRRWPCPARRTRSGSGRAGHAPSRSSPRRTIRYAVRWRMGGRGPGRGCRRRLAGWGHGRTAVGDP